MDAAVVGLAGVVVGALCTGVFTLAFQVRAERRASRQAARLIFAEVETLAGHLETLLATGRTPAAGLGLPSGAGYLPVSAWESHRDTLALSEEIEPAWEDLVSLYNNVAGFRAVLAADGPDAELAETYPPKLRDGLAFANAALRNWPERPGQRLRGWERVAVAIGLLALVGSAAFAGGVLGVTFTRHDEPDDQRVAYALAEELALLDPPRLRCGGQRCRLLQIDELAPDIWRAKYGGQRGQRVHSRCYDIRPTKVNFEGGKMVGVTAVRCD